MGNACYRNGQDDVSQAGAQHRHQGQSEQDTGEYYHRVDKAHDYIVDNPSPEPRKEANNQAHGHRKSHRSKCDLDRYPGTGDETAEDIPS